MKQRNLGFTILELIIVIGIIGIIAGIGAVSWNAAARRASAQGAVSTFQQSVWQGATAAASRGIVVELVREGDELRLLNVNNANAVLRRYDLPAGVTISAENPILRFLPPGKVDLPSLDPFSDGLMISADDSTYRLELSLIGEVRSQKVGAD